MNGGQTESTAASPLILERFNTKASANKQALDNMFDANSTSQFSAEQLARLQEIDKMVSGTSKTSLSTAVTKFSSDISASGSVLTLVQKDASGNAVQTTDANGNTIDKVVSVRETSGQFTEEFYKDDTFTGTDAKNIAMAEIQNRVLNAAQTNDAISSAMNSLLVGAIELKVSDDVNNPNDLEIKEKSGKLLSLASTLESISTSIPTVDLQE